MPISVLVYVGVVTHTVRCGRAAATDSWLYGMTDDDYNEPFFRPRELTTNQAGLCYRALYVYVCVFRQVLLDDDISNG